MKRLGNLVYAMLVLLVVIAAWCYARNPEAPGEEVQQPSLVARLRSPRAEEVDQAKAELLAERQELISELLKIVGDSELRQTNRRAVLTAIELLGDLRAAEAAEPLSDLLLYGWKSEIRDSMERGRIPPPPDKAAPAVPALSKIGVPALRPVTEKLIAIQEDTENRNRLQLHCLWVIKDILDPRLGKAYIAHLLETDERAANSRSVKDGLNFMDVFLAVGDEGS